MQPISIKLTLSVLLLGLLPACPGGFELFRAYSSSSSQASATSGASVRLWLTAMDGNGQPVIDLRMEELRLFDDGKEQTIESIEPARAVPLRLVWLIDYSASRKQLMPGADIVLTPWFFDAVMKENDQAAVVGFNDKQFLFGEFGSDPIERRRVLEVLPLHPRRGPTAILDALDWLHRASSFKDGRRVVVILSDGLDNASRMMLEPVRETLRRSDTAIVFVRFVGESSWGEERRARRLAQELASETGGLPLEVANPAELRKALATVAAVLENQYVVTYSPTSTRRAGKFRKLGVKCTRKGVKVWTRKGYYPSSTP